jgi:alpha-acetolactate decarboxylase
MSAHLALGFAFRLVVAALAVAPLAGCKDRRDQQSQPSVKISSLKPLIAGASGAVVIPITLHNSLDGLTKGRLGAAVSLGAVSRGRALVGIGSLSGLRGEIAILDGAIWVSYPNGEGVRTERLEQRDELVAFLATPSVDVWISHELDHTVPYERIPAEVERAVAQTKLDRSRPFPIVIEGELSDLKFNVVDGSALTNDHPSREDMLRTAVKVDLPAARGSLVGYYFQHEQPALIHAGQHVHLHVVLPEANQMGHLDAVTIQRGARSRLPQR